MEFHIWALFALSILIAAISSGPNVVIVMVKTITHGSTGALWSIFGNLCCLFFVAILASIGVGATIATAPMVFFIMKIAGAFYLIWMGGNMIRSSFQKKQKIDLNSFHGENRQKVEKSRLVHFGEAFLISASNPKSIIFLTAIFPQFLNTKIAILPQFVIMFITIIALVFLVHGTYALIANHLRTRSLNHKFYRWFTRVSGGVFITFGAHLALSK